jgi:hypothetical protein
MTMTDTLIDTIRAAVASDASAEARAAGVAACHALLTALGEPAPSSRVEPGPIATAVAQVLRSTPPDQLLDMAIAKLQALVPPDAKPSVPKMHILYVPVPK